MPIKRFVIPLIIILTTQSIALAKEPNSILSGQWMSDCVPIGKNDRHGQTVKIQIVNSRMTATAQIYETNSCERPTVRVNYAGVITADEFNGIYIDFQHKVEKITFTLNTDNISKYYNKNFREAGCGMTGWKTNESRSVTGKTCAPFSFAAEGITLYDRAWINANQLRFGGFPSAWHATSDAQRPTIPLQTFFNKIAE